MRDRTLRINELLRQEANAFVQRELEFPAGSMVTIVKVITAPDLATAKLLVSIYPTAMQAEVFLQLQQSIPDLSQTIAAKLRAYRMPKLRWVLDKQEEKATRIFELLDEAGGKG